MKVLITGGSGYIGTELTYLLEPLKEIEEIVIYDNLSRKNFNLFIGKSKLPHQKVRLVLGDLLDSRKLEAEVKNTDVIFHLAAKVTTPFADYNPHEFDQINNWGTAELSYLVEKHGVEKFIYASSVSVYGASDQLIQINSKTDPKTFYGNSKLLAEKHLGVLKNSNVYILRLGNVFGYSKSMRFDSVINKFMFEANYSRKIHIMGNGNQKRSFVQINRLSDFLKKILTSDLQPGTYNIVENTYSVNEIVDGLLNLYKDLEMVFVNQNAKMRSIHVEPDHRIEPYFTNKLPLETDLLNFRKEFSF